MVLASYEKTFSLTFLILIIPFSLLAQDDNDMADYNQGNKQIVAGHLNSSEYTEYAPSISADGKTMIIESDRNGHWQLFESKLTDDGSWSEPIPLEKVNNHGDSTDLIGGPSISYDGNTLYLFASFDGGYGSEDIYYCERESDGWGEPVNIGSPINTSSYEGFPSVSSDGKALYFTRMRAEDPFEKDKDFNETCYAIYVSYKDRNGQWQEPVALPYPVNYLCDKAPRIMADNRTLIFSSYRPGEVRGSFDLFQSQVNEDEEWSMPVALDYVNTPDADQFACISAEGDRMYFFTRDDIYSVVIPEELRQFKNVIMQGSVIDGENKAGIGAEIVASDAQTSERLFTIENNPQDGRYSIVMAAGNTYNIEFIKDGYTTGLYSYDLVSMNAYDEISQDVALFSDIRLKLNIFDQELYEALPAEISIFQMPDSTLLKSEMNDISKGFKVVTIPAGGHYFINIGLEHFSGESFSFDLTGKVFYRDFEKDIQLTPQKVDIPINVTDVNTNGSVRGRIIIKNQNRDEVIEVNSNEMISLRLGDRYAIEATSDKGYFFASTTIDVTSDGIKTVDDRDVVAVWGNNLEIKLTPIIVNTSLNLNDILFESNSAQLSAVSYEELSRVVDVMLKNPTMKVEISAHTDDVGSEGYNLALSEKRAQSVVDHLISKSIPENRFVAVGYGESRPITNNTSEDNRAKNRRVELKVLEVLN